jgi:hypothetical protein
MFICQNWLFDFFENRGYESLEPFFYNPWSLFLIDNCPTWLQTSVDMSLIFVITTKFWIFEKLIIKKSKSHLFPLFEKKNRIKKLPILRYFENFKELYSFMKKPKKTQQFS